MRITCSPTHTPRYYAWRELPKDKTALFPLVLGREVITNLCHLYHWDVSGCHKPACPEFRLRSASPPPWKQELSKQATNNLVGNICLGKTSSPIFFAEVQLTCSWSSEPRPADLHFVRTCNVSFDFHMDALKSSFDLFVSDSWAFKMDKTFRGGLN